MRPCQALSPGLSVSETEPSGENLSWFSPSSSRSLGRSLLLGQRSRMNYFSHHIGSLLFEDRIDPSGELSGHRHDRFPRRPIARMALIHRAVELPKLRVLADGRPSGLDQFTAQPTIAAAGDVTARHSISGGMLARSQTDESRQLAHVTDLLRITDARQKMTGHNLANPRNAFEIFHRLAKLRILLVEAADLLNRLKDPLLRGLQTFHQLVKLEPHRRTARKSFKLPPHAERPLAAGGSRGKLQPLEQQQGFNAKLHRHKVLHKGISKLNELAQLAIGLRGHMNTLQLPAAQMLGELLTVESVGLHSLTRHFGDHRGGGHHANVTLTGQPIIQAPTGGTGLVGKGDLLPFKVFAYKAQQMFGSVRHAEGLENSLMAHKGDRDAFLIDIQSTEDLELPRNKVLLFHPKASSVQRLLSHPLYAFARPWSRSQHPSYKSQDRFWNSDYRKEQSEMQFER